MSNPNGSVDDDAIAQYARAVCGTYERCGPPIYPDRDTCIDGMTCSLRSLVFGTSLTRGELLSCANEVGNVVCGSDPVLPNACMALLDTFAESLGEEPGCGGELCSSDQYCDRSDDHCPSCAAYAKLGEPCVDERCARGAYCSISTRNCEPIKTKGMPCERASECTPQIFGSSEWLTCRDGICTTAVPLGGACRQPADCALFLDCKDSVCTERARVGEACVAHQDCAAYSACVRGTCTALCGLQRAGGPCPHDAFCRESYCDEASSTCAATKPAGAACTRTAECSDGLFCDAATAACAERLADGAACALDDACTSALCLSQVCEQPVCDG